MILKSIAILIFCASCLHAEDSRSIESTLSSLSNIIIPNVDFTDETTVSEVIYILNLHLRSPDPPPPKSWKIHLDVSQKVKSSKITLKGKNLHLHKVLGKIADQIEADIVVNGKGYILRVPKKQAEQVTAPNP